MTHGASLSSAHAVLPHVTWPCEPIEGIARESLVGLLFRTADWNAIRKPSVLLTDAGLPPHQRVGSIARTSAPLSDLATVMAVPEDWVAGRRHAHVGTSEPRSVARIDFGGAALREAHLDYRTRRYSPSALRESSHHREIWHVATIPLCIESGELLQDVCPDEACARPLVWTRTRGMSRCSHPSCNARLDGSAGTPVDPRHAPAAIACAALVHGSPGIHGPAIAALPEALRHENRGDLFELAWILGCLDDPDCASVVATPTALDPERRCAALARGHERLLAWPRCVEEMLRNGMGSDAEAASTPSVVKAIRRVIAREATFGRAAALLKQVLDGATGPAMMTAVGRIMGMVTTRGLSELAGIERSDIRRLRHAGLIEHVAFRDGQRTSALYHPDVGIRIREGNRRRIDARAAATRLGMSVDGIYDLVSAGLLEREDDPIIRFLWPHPHVTPDSMAALVERLERCIPIEEPDGGRITLRMGLRACAGPDKPWSATVGSILAGDLEMTRRRGGRLDVRDCLMLPSSIVRLAKLRMVRPDPTLGDRPEWISDADAWDRLGCGSLGLRHLVRSEQLSSSGRHDGATFLRSDVDALQARLVHTCELRARLGLFRQGLVEKLLASEGLVPDRGGFLDRTATCRALGL